MKINKSLFKIISNNEKGFSLAELMVTAGIMGMISLGIMQMIQNQNKAMINAESKSEEIQLINQIRTTLIKKENCDATFTGEPLNAVVTDVKLENGNNIFTTNNIYGNRVIRIDNMNLSANTVPGPDSNGTVKLNVTLTRLKKRNGIKTITKSIMLQVRTDATNNIAECFSESQNSISTAKEESCLNIGGTYNAALDTCNLSDPCTLGNANEATSTKCLETIINEYLRLDGGTMTGPLIATDITANNLCIGANCRSTFAIQDCPNGQLVKTINVDGTVDCSPTITCPANQYLEGISSVDGSAICKALPTESCPTDQYVREIKSDGTVVCQAVPVTADVTCPTGEYIQKIVAGVPTCASLCSGNSSRVMYQSNSVLSPATCQSETQNRTCNSGSWGAWSGSYNYTSCSSCTPVCPAAITICAGTTYTGTNGCGSSCNVSGTKICCNTSGTSNLCPGVLAGTVTAIRTRAVHTGYSCCASWGHTVYKSAYGSWSGACSSIASRCQNGTTSTTTGGTSCSNSTNTFLHHGCGSPPSECIKQQRTLTCICQ